MKQIKMTNDMREKAIQQFVEHMESIRYFDTDKINFSYKFQEEKEKELASKPVIYITPIAWLKIQQLVLTNDTEVGWHGIVVRKDNSFLIKDVMLYPQKVTGSTINTDETEYTKWTMDLDDDTINNLRFQGHSHVRMQTSPSNTDTTYYNALLQNLCKDEFYIFMIINKSLDVNLMLYDLKENVMYEKKDLIFKIAFKEDIHQWAANEYKKHVKSFVATTTSNLSKYNFTTPTDPDWYSTRRTAQLQEESAKLKDPYYAEQEHRDYNIYDEMYKIQQKIKVNEKKKKDKAKGGKKK